MTLTSMPRQAVCLGSLPRWRCSLERREEGTAAAGSPSGVLKLDHYEITMEIHCPTDVASSVGKAQDSSTGNDTDPKALESESGNVFRTSTSFEI